MNKIKVVFMGTPQLSVPVLEGLLELDGFEVVGVVTQPDKPAGRGNEVTQSPIKILAASKNIPALQPEKITPEVVESIGKLSPDIVVVAAYGHIIPKSLIEMPKYKCINIHGSLLPKYRGASPIQWAILEGEKETGISIMLMDEKMDHGPILEQAKIDIAPDETSSSLFNKMSALSKEVIKDVLPRWIDGKLKPKEQDEKKVSFTKILTKDDGKIFWNNTAERIERKIRAFEPWPNCFTFYDEKSCKILEEKTAKQKNVSMKEGFCEENLKRLKILKARVGCHVGLDPTSHENTGKHETLNQVQDDRKFGEVVLTENKELGVVTSDGMLILEIVQPEGKKKMTGQEFLNGHPNIVGGILR